MSKLRLSALPLAFVVAVLLLAACSGGTTETSPTPTPPATGTPTQTASAVAATATANDTAAPPAEPPAETQPPPVTDPPAAGVTILSPVDKDHALPADYVPPGLAAIPGAYLAPGFGGELRQEAVDALVRMLDDADAAGHDVRARSAYRSYATQESTFNYWVSALGYDEAVRVSAMPGHSEHQLGTTADLTSPQVGWGLLESFGQTAAGQWLAANAHVYGFALSYPAGAEVITGYSYEPWHFRYIGTAEAQAWNASGLTLNQYLLQ
ncbi:MAG: M15 family metallopeptidase [Chloroflexi bacterium]|nr:M15 family metallopeptidase [Chloroflexota bacterium]